MILPNDYDSTKAYDGTGGYTPLPVGGHICRIVGARATQSSKGNDMIEIAFDIAEGGEYDGKFKERHDFLRKSKPDAKWPNGGMFRTGILTKDGKTSGYFKGLITAVEESNPGYSFKGSGCNEATLKGKLVGFNFGEEEYMYNGEVRVSVKPFWAVGVDRVKAGIEPPKRKALKQEQMPSGFVEVPSEDLPGLPF